VGRKHADVLPKFDESIRLAEKERNLMEQAMACERAGLYLRDSGSSLEAISYFEQAQRLYQEWGSIFKMDQVKGYIRVERLNVKSLRTR
jgi:hypothetical protein